MPLDISNPAITLFLKENYEKENRIRINWTGKNRDMINMAATLTREPTEYFESDVTAHNMKGGLAALNRDHITSGRNRRLVPIRDGTFIPGVKHLRRGHSIVDIGLGEPKVDPRLARPDTDLSMDPVMRPIDPQVKKIVHSIQPGRLTYLEKRSKVMPEKKYYFQECSGWEYGWRLGDSKLLGKCKYGKRWILTKNLFSRVGPQPDPSHYKESEEPGVSKC